MSMVERLKSYFICSGAVGLLRRYRVILSRRFIVFDHAYYNLKIEPRKKTVCVIISCWNKLEYTKQAIESYYKALDTDHNYVLLVMDDGSSDGTKQYFLENNKKFNNICYLRYKANMGLTQTWNDGISFALKKVKPTHVFLVNNDVIMPKGAFKGLMDHFERNHKLGAIGPLTNTPGFEPRQDIRKYYHAYSPSDSMKDIEITAGAVKGNEPVTVDHINGFFMGISKEALEANIYSHELYKAYYFNPLNRNIHNEDEFLSRLARSGYQVAIAANTFIFHYKDISQNRFSHRKELLYRHD